MNALKSNSSDSFKNALNSLILRYNDLRVKYPEYNNIISFFEAIFVFFESRWEFYIQPKSLHGGRPQVPRIALQFTLIYLLYFSKDSITRTLDKINMSQALKGILLVDDKIITRPTLNRFIELLEEAQIDCLFADTVRIGIKEEIITLNSHIIDAGKVIANVNPSRFLSFPTKTHEEIVGVINQIDFSKFDKYDVKKQGKRYLVKDRLKLLTLQIIAGLGSLGTAYTFLETYPYFETELGFQTHIPSLQCMRTWMTTTFYNSEIESNYNMLWFEIYFLLYNEPAAIVPTIVKSLDDLFGSLGSKFSRVDRGARVGYKPSNKSNWIGYKDHVSIDSKSGFPVLITVTSGNVHDTKEYNNHLKILKTLYGDISKTEYSYGDRGYDSEANREACREILRAEPRITNRNATTEQKKEHKKWSSIRQAVERTIGRTVMFLRKNDPPFRGRPKITVWVKMGYLVVLMFGLSCYLTNEPELAHCISLFL